MLYSMVIKNPLREGRADARQSQEDARESPRPGGKSETQPRQPRSAAEIQTPRHCFLNLLDEFLSIKVQLCIALTGTGLKKTEQELYFLPL